MIPELVDIIRKAGKAILEIYDTSDIGVEYKEDNSPLTKADRASHSIILEELRAFRPEIPVISEESAEIPYEKRKEWNRFWLVDPLDGTKEFIKRNGEFTINIALLEEGAPILGMIMIPVRGAIYYGGRGTGAFRISSLEAKAEQIKVCGGERRPVAAVSRSHLSEKTSRILEDLGADAVNAGSALKFTLIAEGDADLYPRLGPTWEWDTAAGHAIAAAAGAVVCGLDGQPLRYNKEILKHEGFLVCSPALKDRALEEIAKVL